MLYIIFFNLLISLFFGFGRLFWGFGGIFFLIRVKEIYVNVGLY